jgi:hypothetical protein
MLSTMCRRGDGQHRGPKHRQNVCSICGIDDVLRSGRNNFLEYYRNDGELC